MDYGRRNTKKYSFRCPDLKELRKLSSFVLDPLNFKQRHGKLLFVLSTEVVEGLLSVLVQFYDPLYRYFMFPDYQLVLMLEQYSYLLGMSVSNKVPFSGLEEILTSQVIVEALHLKKYEIYANMVKKGGILGLTSEFILGRAISEIVLSGMLSHYAKNRRENETTKPPPCVIYPKGGKGNARSKPGKDMVSRPERDGIGSRLCEGKVLAPLRIRRTRRDPLTKE
ncbi:hypothetical protein KIW84_022248 [Lathyrus oleraceus]|uniref:DUF7745 domain-containing protein n=1 Tax=Pisum sativum TaxID=3888 RepID=A0A9D4YB86_PEA|nr:hypothetical protein KIW84_022248 [Pisum sativum]